MLLSPASPTFWLADSLYLVGNANGTYTPGPWFDVGWWIGARPDRAAPPGSRRGQRSAARPTSARAGSSSRSCFGAGGLAVLVYGCVDRTSTSVAVTLAAASLVAVMARTMLTFRDNVAMLRDVARGGARPTR